MNSVERVKSICKERKIAISKLERELGFSNGYIAQLRKGTFPADRLADIAAYLSVSTEYLLTGEENKKAPTENGERDILDEVDIGFYQGYKELDESDKEVLRDMVRVMRERRATKNKMG